MSQARSDNAPDVGRRVIQCECARTCWTGEENARAAGWRRTWPPTPGGELAPVWTCPDCSVLPRLPPAPMEMLPAYLDDLFNAGRVELVMEQLELLRVESTPHFRAYLEVLEHRECARPRRARWRAFCARHRQRSTPELAKSSEPRGRRRSA